MEINKGAIQYKYDTGKQASLSSFFLMQKFYLIFLHIFEVGQGVNEINLWEGGKNFFYSIEVLQ